MALNCLHNAPSNMFWAFYISLTSLLSKSEFLYVSVKAKDIISNIDIDIVSKYMKFIKKIFFLYYIYLLIN